MQQYSSCGNARAPRPLSVLDPPSHVRAGPVRRLPARPRQGPSSGGPVSVTESALSPIEVLKKENELLKRIIESSEYSIEELQKELDSMGIEIPASLQQQIMDEKAKQATTAVDYWSPAQQGYPDGFPDIKGELQQLPSHDGTPCCSYDNNLGAHQEHFKYRWAQFHRMLQAINDNEGGMEKFTRGYEVYGIFRGEHEGKTGIWYREWAPAARAVALVGEFNAWDPQPEHWGIKNEFGVFQLFLPDNADGTQAIPHRTKIKCRVEDCNGEWAERIPAWIKWATQEWNEIQFNGVYYQPMEKSTPGVFHPEKEYVFKYPRPARPRALRIYECHVGMSSAEPKVNSYLEFKEDVLPRIRELGYNAIQIMAIQEHAYYGSFGYHVTNFFAASSRQGTPDELKAMIDEAHRLGLVVLMDVVHSHASKNTMDGINMFDGTDHQYFHSGGRGYHWMWDSRLFNYGNWETLRYLLSNSRWWMDEYKFDGYRFDGVTSMMYHHHGLSMAFTGNYDEYFGMATDVDALVYMMMVNYMIHSFWPEAITIGEDVSGFPTFCRPVQEGGIGFDYRLAMAIPDKWIELLSKMGDDAWSMNDIVWTLTNRRYAENVVAYAESHDQALVGDKTIAFWLMDAAMYDSMGVDSNNPAVDRGIALHKMIRLITMALGGESYLTFMGNEFGHPEWIDFPRDDTYDPSTGAFVPGNGGSFEKCRRRWDLADSPALKYRFMKDFDRAIMHLDKAFGFLNAPHTYVSRKDEADKLISFERGDLVFVFNFHPVNSYNDYRIGCSVPGPYKMVLSSDEGVFGGWENVSKKYDVEYQVNDGDFDNRPKSFTVYAPSRTVAVYGPAEWGDATADQKPTGVPGVGIKDRGPYYER